MVKSNLTKNRCACCEGMGQALTKTAAQKYLRHVPGWQMDKSGKQIFREYKTKNFVKAVAFINKVAKVAEKENHHPDIHLTGYRNVRIDLSTHAVGGLSENDFILAAK